MFTEYESEKYNCTSETLRSTLDNFGVAVIPDVLSNSECNLYYDQVWQYFEFITGTWNKPISRNDQTTWRSFYKFYPLHSMLFQSFNVGHCQASWNIRQNPKVVDVFSKFWNVSDDELLVSFDGLSFHLPPEVTNKGWSSKKTKFHCDQSFTNSEFDCLQSWIGLTDTNFGDATLYFYEGSHKYHKDFATEFHIAEKSNWYQFDEKQEKFYSSRCLRKKICCPKGSLVLWDSRTVHCGVEAMKGREKQNVRSVVYVCYKPRKDCTAVNLKKRIKYFEELRTTSHQVLEPKLFAFNPRTYGGELTPEILTIQRPELTELGMKLVGY